MAANEGGWQPCPYMPLNATPDTKNVFGSPYGQLMRQFEAMTSKILQEYRGTIDHIEIVYQCSFEADMKNPATPIANFFRNSGARMERIEPMIIRSFLRGGNVETFQMVADTGVEEEEVIDEDEQPEPRPSPPYTIHYLYINR